MADAELALLKLGDNAVPREVARSSSPAWPRRRSTATESCSTRLLRESLKSSRERRSTRVLVGSGRYLGRAVPEAEPDDPFDPDEPDDPEGCVLMGGMGRAGPKGTLRYLRGLTLGVGCGEGCRLRVTGDGDLVGGA